MEKSAEPSRWARNQIELAEALDVNRKTVARWLKRDGNPGRHADGRYDVAAWCEWAKSQGHVFETPEKAALEAALLCRKGKLLDIEIKKRLGQVTDNDKLERWVAEMVGAAKTVLLSLPAILAPQVVGLPIAEAEQRIREGIYEALSQLDRRPWEEAAQQNDDGD